MGDGGFKALVNEATNYMHTTLFPKESTHQLDSPTFVHPLPTQILQPPLPPSLTSHTTYVHTSHPPTITPFPLPTNVILKNHSRSSTM